MLENLRAWVAQTVFITYCEIKHGASRAKGLVAAGRIQWECDVYACVYDGVQTSRANLIWKYVVMYGRMECRSGDHSK